MGVKVREKDGKWYVFINHQGKRKIEAKLKLRDLDLLDDKPQVPTFEEYAEKWLEQDVTVACKRSSQRVIRGIVHNRLVPYFGTRDLASITRAQVITFLTEKHQRYSRKYVRDLVRTLHTLLAHAVEEEVMDRNSVAELVKYLTEKRFDWEKEINPFTSEAVARYLATMRKHYLRHYVYFLCLARTGMREGEALGLFWDAIQFGQDVNDPAPVHSCTANP